MTVDWLDPWYPIADPDHARCFEEELHKEVIEGHPLYGLTATAKAIGRVDGVDDYLFSLADGRVAEVHLTWRGRPEIAPQWPGTAMFDSIVVWRAWSMEPRHREWLDEG